MMSVMEALALQVTGAKPRLHLQLLLVGLRERLFLSSLSSTSMPFDSEEEGAFSFVQEFANL